MLNRQNDEHELCTLKVLMKNWLDELGHQATKSGHLFAPSSRQQYVPSIDRNSKRVIYVFPSPPIMAHLARGNIGRSLFRPNPIPVSQAVSELRSFEY